MLTAYNSAIAEKVLKFDPAQAAAAEKLDVLSRALTDYRPGLFRRKEAPKGLYIWGDVGRGKSMLMDLFFENARITPKRRVHFNAFMVDVHARIHAERQRQGSSDPIPPVARGIAAEARLLCFDEFQVTHVADAMILGRLFEQFFALGTVIVTTSNAAPERLYEGGINRELFLPFIAQIKQRLEMVELNGPTDYRLQRMAGLKVYLMPLSAENDAAMDQAWVRLTGGAKPKTVTLRFLGRALVVPAAAGGVARFSFADLCMKPLAAPDYLAIAQDFHTVLIDHVPVMGEDMPHAARRFVVLIDTLYDEGVKLICSAAAEPDRLYPDGKGVAAFRRAASRLTEMQSEDYLKRGHGVHDVGSD
ncbi:MAG TPA: cell division protein ZapE [Rhizomicrobium sp.]|nr:cell division protein ZapE [Rhizomicrobium sp.]